MLDTTKDFSEAAEVLKDVLGLGHEPVAVKMFEDIVALDGFEFSGKLRYCQMLVEAAGGKRFLAQSEPDTCGCSASCCGQRQHPLGGVFDLGSAEGTV